MRLKLLVIEGTCKKYIPDKVVDTISIKDSDCKKAFDRLEKIIKEKWRK